MTAADNRGQRSRRGNGGMASSMTTVAVLLLAAIVGSTRAADLADVLPDSPAARKANDALTRYERMLEQVQVKGIAAGKEKELYEQVLQPAIKLGDELLAKEASDDLKERVDRFYAARGWLIWEGLGKEWFEGTPELARAQVLESYEQAVRLKKTPEVVAARIEAQLALKPLPDWLGLLEDAWWLTTTAPNMPQGHRLLGSVLHSQARTRPEPVKLVEGLRRALDSYDAGIERCAEKPEFEKEKALLFIARSCTHTYIVNYDNQLDEAQKRDCIGRARKDAEAALQLKGCPQEKALEMLGFALEDLAWIAKDQKAYPQAIEVYTKAIQLGLPESSLWMDRGRCRYKWAESELYYNPKVDRQAQERALQGSIGDSQKAIQRNDNAWVTLEAWYWLGKAYKLRPYAQPDAGGKNWTEAEAAFEKATKLAEEYKAPAWSKLALYDWAFLVLFEAQAGKNAEARLAQARELAKQLETYDPTWARALLIQIYVTEADLALRNRNWEAVRKCSRQLAPYDPIEASRLEATALCREGKHEEALKVYQETIKIACTPGDRTHVQLNLEYLIYLYSNELPRKLQPGPEAVLKQADALLKLVTDSLDPPMRGTAYGASGFARYLVFTAARNPEARRSEVREKGIEHLGKALELASTHSDASYWLLKYTELSLDHLKEEKDRARWQSYRDNLAARLGKRIAAPSVDSNKENLFEIRILLKELEKMRPPS